MLQLVRSHGDEGFECTPHLARSRFVIKEKGTTEDGGRVRTRETGGEDKTNERERPGGARGGGNGSEAGVPASSACMSP